MRYRSIVAAVLCMVAACNEIPETAQEITEAQPVIPKVAMDINAKVSVVNGLLKLKDGAEFENLVRTLNESEDVWQQEFIRMVTGLDENSFEGLSPEALDRLAFKLESAEEKLRLKDDHAYRRFEELLQHRSLRSELDEATRRFLSIKIPGSEGDPDDHFISGTAERTLLNWRGEIMVGGRLYRFYPNGVTYEVTDGDFHTLRQLNEEHAYKVFTAPNVRVHNMHAMSTDRLHCRTWVTDRRTGEYLPGEYMYRSTAGHRCLVFTNYVFSKVKHYKKLDGQWQPRRAYLRTWNWGAHGMADPGNLNASCFRQMRYESRHRSRFRKKLTSRQITFGIGFGKIQSGAVTAFTETNGVQEKWVLLF